MATEHFRSDFCPGSNPLADHQHMGTQNCDLFDLAVRPHEELEGDGSAASSIPHPSFAARAEIWRSFREGQISFAEAQRRSAKIGALAEKPIKPVRLMHGAPGKPRPPVARPRETRPEPNESRQYANPMATTAARDDRLTPQAKALLQVIRARAGKGRETQTTKGTLAAILSRSTRSITRYLRDLERCGYVTTRTRADHRGLHLGLVLTITEKVMPFYSNLKKLGAWLGESVGLKPIVPFMPFATGEAGQGRAAALDSDDGLGTDQTRVVGNRGVTLLSSKNQTHNDSSCSDSNGLRKIDRATFAASD
ncbi:helix-turn-helix domain-containing protein [Fulvimarina pelagi]|nr:helix-turn-helix domain-containing protein [Fulvimarina pelagi]